MILGVGTDLVDVARIGRLIAKGGDRFLNRWFCPAEVAYCLDRSHPARHVAVRFAAKEATIKAIGLSIDGPPPWRSIEIDHVTAGAPQVRLHDNLRQLATESAVASLHLAWSSTPRYATATVIAVSGAESTRR